MKKIKLFSTDAVSHKLAFDVENEVNEFCKDKKVVDFKVSETRNLGKADMTVMVIYEEGK